MNWIIKIIISIILLFTGPLSPTIQNQGKGKLILGGEYTLSEGQTLDGSLMILGATVVLEPGSLVDGDVLIVGGSLDIAGRVSQNVVSLGGLVHLRETATVNGDMQIPAGSLNRTAGAQVDGQIIQGLNSVSPIIIPGGVQIPNIQVNLNPFWYGFSVLSKVLQAFLWAALAALVVVFLPQHTETVSKTLVGQPLLAGGLGLLTWIVSPIFLVITAITLVGIPVTLAGAMLLFISCIFGVIAIGAELGQRIKAAVKQNWALAVSAAFGTFVLTLALGLLSLLQCVGWIGWVIITSVGLGAVVVSRYGTQKSM